MSYKKNKTKKYFLGLAIDINDDEYILCQGDGTCNGCEVTKKPMYCNLDTCIKNKYILKRR